MIIALSLALVVAASVAFVSLMLVAAVGINLRRADAECDRLQDSLRDATVAYKELERSFDAYRDAVNGLSDYSRQPWERN